MSEFNYIDKSKKILEQVYRLSLSQNEVPVERFICNIIDDIR